MKALKTLSNEEASVETKAIFRNIQQKVGRVPNLYAAMGNSPQLLGGFLAFEGSLKSGTFSSKENEAIALAVSQANECNYCLAAHSALGKMAGYSEREIIDIRRGTITDSKLKALITLAVELTKKRGKASQEAVDNFLAAGYSKQSFAELIGMVAIRNITNYIFSNGDFEIDFPKATVLKELIAA
ncbi:MAG: putative peroxidase-related enzyme [Paraglaciecola sp.]|jgi:uncharacterized peroxidase-related enzyme